jgi:hypothetical protein
MGFLPVILMGAYRYMLTVICSIVFLLGLATSNQCISYSLEFVVSTSTG